MSRIKENITANKRESKVVVVTGPAASGKSEIIRIADIPENFEVREVGDELLVTLQESGISIISKDDIRRLPAALVNKAVKQLLKKIVETATKNQLIVGHLVYPQGSQYVSLTEFYKKVVQPDIILPVMTFGGELSQRQQQAGRNRVQFSPKANNRLQARIVREALDVGEATGALVVPLISTERQNPLTKTILGVTFQMLDRT